MKLRGAAVLIMIVVAIRVFGQTNGPGIGDVQTYRAIIESQHKTYDSMIQSQQKLGSDVLDSIKHSHNTFFQVVQAISLTVGILVALFGGIIGLNIKNLRRRVSEFDARREDLEKEIENLKVELTQCYTHLENYKQVQDRLEGVEKLEDMVKDTTLRAQVANWRVRFMSVEPKERQHAIEAAAQCDSVLAIPLLLDCIRDKQQEEALIAEALYGLARQASKIKTDQEAIGAVLNASKHHDKIVRQASIKVLAKIGPANALVAGRLQELRDSDSATEVKTEARHVLQDALGQ